MVMVGDSPGPGIEIEAFVERASLRGAAEFGIDVAAADRPVPAARSRVVFEQLDLVSHTAEFVGRRHSRQTRAENDDRGALRVAFKPDRPPPRRLRGEPEA